MRHDVALDGIAFRLRPVELTDARSIVDLRRDPARSQFIHATSPSVEAQVAWLTSYFDRDGDWYWAVERMDTGAIEGFVGIYDPEGGTAEWGRWVLRPGSLAAPESAWLVHEAGFRRLGLQSLLSRTLVDNRAVLALHARYGVEVVRTLPAHARVGGVVQDAVEGRMTAERWAAAGPLLAGMAHRAAALVRRSARAPAGASNP